MKHEARQYYENYKELKKAFAQERLQLFEETKKVQDIEKRVLCEKEKVDLLYEEDLREKVYFKNKIGFQNSIYLDQDIDDMIDILNTLKFENDIFDGLSEKEVSMLNFVLNKYKGSKNEATLIQTFKACYKDEEEENLVSKIEFIVNELVSENKINEIKIHQITNTQFEFNDIKANLFIENGALKVKPDTADLNKKGSKIESKEEFVNLDAWLITNFPYKPPKYLGKTNAAVQSLKKSVNKAVERVIRRKSLNDRKV